MKKIGDWAFINCTSLKRITLNENLETFEDAFRGSEVEEITFLKTLKKISNNTFSGFKKLKRIYVTNDCRIDSLDIRPDWPIEIGPLPDTITGNIRVWDLRSLKQVVIPNGTRVIGSCWFFGSGIESVEIPESVQEIGDCAFCDCRNLKAVALTKDSQLERVGKMCFCNS